MLLSNKYHRLGAIDLHIALLDSSINHRCSSISSSWAKYFPIGSASIFWSPTKIFLFAICAASAPAEFWEQKDIQQIFKNIHEYSRISNDILEYCETCEGRAWASSVPRSIYHMTHSRSLSCRSYHMHSTDCLIKHNSVTRLQHHCTYPRMSPISQVLLHSPHWPHSPTLQSSFSFTLSFTWRRKQIFSRLKENTRF